MISIVSSVCNSEAVYAGYMTHFQELRCHVDAGHSAMAAHQSWSQVAVLSTTTA